jgi:quercetin dioxygenase-like cupin family protein
LRQIGASSVVNIKPEIRPTAPQPECAIPMPRPRAVSTVQTDQARVKVTEWRFAPGAETGRRRHTVDCVVVPMTTGTLLLETPTGEVRSPLTAGVP